MFEALRRFPLLCWRSLRRLPSLRIMGYPPLDIRATTSGDPKSFDVEFGSRRLAERLGLTSTRLSANRSR